MRTIDRFHLKQIPPERQIPEIKSPFVMPPLIVIPVKAGSPDFGMPFPYFSGIFYQGLDKKKGGGDILILTDKKHSKIFDSL